MESFLPLGGFQLPFQRRLSRLYSDTKKSSDFVKEPVQNEEDPEIKGLHRKLRIQKDRLVSWGLQWSEPNQSAEIDESLSNAGLSEVVGSIMSTIKDILAEAEPLWLSSKHLADGGRPSGDRKQPLVQWDKGRFEDLVRDLTSSIDTLYDLSRTRSSAAAGLASSKTAFKSPAPVDDFRPFESTRMQTPQHIDPKSLTHLRPRHGEPGTGVREVVFMSKTAYSELTRGTTRQPWAPLLLEYATFDSIYSVTGIMPPMARFERLSAGLQQEPQRSPGTWTGLPRLLGYFEDLENSRLGLVYRFPPSFNAVSFERPTQNPLYNLPSLRDLLCRPDSEPTLEAKFRLAHNFANTVFDLHARGITHGNIVDRNLSFCDAVTTEPGVSAGEVDIRRPILSSFDLFTDEASPAATLSRHPLDPRSTPISPISSGVDERVLELYSVAMVLLSIGLWTRLEDMIPNTSLTSVPESMLDQLSVRCGSLYMKAVQACWCAVDDEMTGRSSGEALLSAVQVRASRFLEACCILDGVSGLEERLGQEIHEAHEATSPRPQKTPLSPVTESFKDVKDIKSPAIPAGDSKPPVVIPEPAQVKGAKRLGGADAENEDALEKSASKAETRIRLYPHVPLSPEVVDKWNTILMPQINSALRGFYRKHPESVEISLESVGPSPQRTQPTVLVVCTSVGKVRAILKKRLGDLFDGSTGFALKVCRGHVLRSHRQSRTIRRSMARSVGEPGDKVDSDDDDEVEAVNPKYQERPGNGASIGAWIGDRHLPPVSFGGLVMVDNKPYGMTVHHMLDDPDRDFGPAEATRSSAIPSHDWYTESLAGSIIEDDFSYELSDTESEAYSDTDITSEYGDEEDEDEEDDEFSEPGDIPGIEPGCGEGYVVTQPALDDVEDGFFPSAETEDEDHLDSFSLGEVYASSGIRRKRVNGMVHEVDWALFEFEEERLPKENLIPRAHGSALPHVSPLHDDSALVQPRTVAPSSALPGMEVQCVARTSGLQIGQILPALTSVKIYGRTSPSHTYQVASAPSATEGLPNQGPCASMGIPGDSGAWVVDRHHGQLCGHVLAWSQRKHVAYICPMDVLLLDIAQALEANEVKLPGGEAVVTTGDPSECPPLHESRNEMAVEKRAAAEERPSTILVEGLRKGEDKPTSPEQHMPSRSISSRSTSPNVRLQTSGDLSPMTSRMYDMSGPVGAGIGVTG